MKGHVFVDTNVLIYARDDRAPAKQEVARRWLRALADGGQLRLNLQVLNEFARWSLSRAPDRDLDAIMAEIDDLRVWGDKALDGEDVELAWVVRRRYHFQWFDCLLVAAAERSGCTTFLTEDMTNRARFNAMTIVNPFTAEPSDLIQH